MFVRSIVVAFVIAASAVSAGNVTLASALHSTPDLSVLRDLSIHFPLIGQYLTSLSNVTILAPSNEAFAAFGNVTALAQSNLPMVQRLLSYHVLNGTHDFASFGTNATFIPTCLVDSASANVTGGQRVSVMKLNGNLAIFSAPGNNSLVTATDIKVSSGIVHIINRLLTIPPHLSVTAAAHGLVAAVDALHNTNLTATVDSTRDLTVFLPIDAAFQAIGSAVANISASNLAAILSYHVVNGTVAYSPSLTNGTMLTALNGEMLEVTVVNGTTFVNSAQVLIQDLETSNGVLHIIDNALNPSNTAIADPSVPTQPPAFGPVTSVTDVSVTSTQTGVSTLSSTGGAWAPMRTGAVGAAALFAAGGALLNV